MKKDPNQLLADADVIYTQAEVDDAISRLASQIANDLQGLSPLVLTVMNGGLYFAGQLLPQLHFPLETDYLHADRKSVV